LCHKNSARVTVATTWPLGLLCSATAYLILRMMMGTMGPDSLGLYCISRRIVLLEHGLGLIKSSTGLVSSWNSLSLSWNSARYHLCCWHELPSSA
jgi:hypothetical protein